MFLIPKTLRRGRIKRAGQKLRRAEGEKEQQALWIKILALAAKYPVFYFKKRNC